MTYSVRKERRCVGRQRPICPTIRPEWLPRPTYIDLSSQLHRPQIAPGDHALRFKWQWEAESTVGGFPPPQPSAVESRPHHWPGVFVRAHRRCSKSAWLRDQSKGWASIPSGASALGVKLLLLLQNGGRFSADCRWDL